MGSMTASKRINAPPERVFKLATDLERAAEHIDCIDKIELLTPPPIGKGTRWLETRTMFGKQATEEMEMTAFDPPSSYTAGIESCGCRYDCTFRFLREGDATNVMLEMNWRPVTWIAWLMSPMSWLMSGVMKKAINQDLGDLKRVAVRG